MPAKRRLSFISEEDKENVGCKHPKRPRKSKEVKAAVASVRAKDEYNTILPNALLMNRRVLAKPEPEENEKLLRLISISGDLNITEFPSGKAADVMLQILHPLTESFLVWNTSGCDVDPGMVKTIAAEISLGYMEIQDRWWTPIFQPGAPRWDGCLITFGLPVFNEYLERALQNENKFLKTMPLENLLRLCAHVETLLKPVSEAGRTISVSSKCVLDEDHENALMLKFNEVGCAENIYFPDYPPRTTLIAPTVKRYEVTYSTMTHALAAQLIIHNYFLQCRLHVKIKSTKEGTFFVKLVRKILLGRYMCDWFHFLHESEVFEAPMCESNPLLEDVSPVDDSLSYFWHSP